jgi:hypothetical protein
VRNKTQAGIVSADQKFLITLLFGLIIATMASGAMAAVLALAA